MGHVSWSRSILLSLISMCIGVGTSAQSSIQPPPPGPVAITGTIDSTRGRCHTIVGDDGSRYAVHRGVLTGLQRGMRVHIVGVAHPNQDCEGMKLIRPNSVRRLAPSG